MLKKFFYTVLSNLKIWKYRLQGARIGKKVVIMPGASIQCPQIEIDDEVVIGRNVKIKSKVLKLGKLSYVGPDSTLHAQRIVFGENVFLNKNVEIGGGGANDPEAEIDIGSHCHIGQEVHLNCCRKIIIGEESTITMRAMIMTHCFANSVLEGYPAIFAPVYIGSRVQIGLQVVVFPGVSIGDEAVVVSNSTVLSNIPAGQMALGIPAKVMGSSKREIKPERRASIAQDIVEEFLRQLSLRGIKVDREEKLPFDIDAIIHHPRGKGRIVFARNFSEEMLRGLPASGEMVAVIYQWEGERNFQKSVNYVELVDKRINGRGGIITDSLREFLRKRGIRLEPRTWSYSGGLL